jgi:hypothetical protein
VVSLSEEDKKKKEEVKILKRRVTKECVREAVRVAYYAVDFLQESVLRRKVGVGR